MYIRYPITFLLNMEPSSDDRIVQIKRARVASSTRKQYEGSNRRFKTFMLEYYPECFEGDDLDLTSVTNEMVEKFIVHLVDTKSIGISALKGYRSAINFLFTESATVLPLTYNEEMGKMYGGLKRIIAESKRSGGGAPARVNWLCPSLSINAL
jgi:hypothetical protein